MLCFIQYHEIPSLTTEDMMILDYQLVGCDVHMEVVETSPAYSFLLPFSLCTEISEHFQRRTPFLKLVLPVQNYRGRNYDEMRSPDALLTCQTRQQGYRLNSLAKSHFIRQDTIEAFVMERAKPLQACHLVLSEFMFEQERHLQMILRR